MGEKIFYTGTFTEHFEVVSFDTDTCKAGIVCQIFAPRRSAYFALSKDKTKLYVANENQGGDGGVSAYDLNNPRLPKLMQVVDSKNQGPSYISVAQIEGKDFVLGAGYFDADITVYPIQPNGLLKGVSCQVHLGNDGHAHCVRMIPGTDYVLTTDTGNSKIYTHKLDVEGRLTQCDVFSHVEVQAERHIAFSRGCNYAYILTEKTSTVVVCQVDRSTGHLAYQQSISTLPAGWAGTSSGAAIHLSGDGRFLYCSNRGHNSIVAFATADNGARLEKLGYLDKGITWPREFAMDSTDRYMFVANERDNSISINTIDPRTGVPVYSAEKIQMKAGPTCFSAF